MIDTSSSPSSNKCFFNFGSISKNNHCELDLTLPLINRTLLVPEPFYPQMYWGYVQQYEIMRIQEMFICDKYSSPAPLNQFVLTTNDSENSFNNR